MFCHKGTKTRSIFFMGMIESLVKTLGRYLKKNVKQKPKNLVPSRLRGKIISKVVSLRPYVNLAR